MDNTQRNGCLLVVAAVLVALAIFGGAATFIVGWGIPKEVIPAVEEAVTVAGPAAVPMEPPVEVFPEYVVQLKEENWPRYERREAGTRLSMEEFVAARLDETSTNLVKTIFRENSEGAAVRFQMKAIDIYKIRDKLQGDFAVEFASWKTGQKKPQRGSVTVRCEFANTSANELLDIRRGVLVTVQGKFSMKTRRPMILEAVLVRELGE